MPENLVLRDGFSRPVPRQPAHLHTLAESGAYSRDLLPISAAASIYALGSVTSLSGHEIAYRWRSLPRVRRHRASKPRGSSERVLPWQVTMDKLICASLSHTHYRYEVGMLKVPAMDKPTGIWLPILLVDIRTCFFFSCLRLGLRIWSRETCSAVPSRDNILILHTQAEPGACTVDHHRVSPELIG